MYQGTVLKRLGPVTYLIELPRGIQWKRHINYIRTRSAATYTYFAQEEGESLVYFVTVAQETTTSTDAVKESTNNTVDNSQLPVVSPTPVSETNPALVLCQALVFHPEFAQPLTITYKP